MTAGVYASGKILTYDPQQIDFYINRSGTDIILEEVTIVSSNAAISVPQLVFFKDEPTDLPKGGNLFIPTGTIARSIIAVVDLSVGGTSTSVYATPVLQKSNLHRRMATGRTRVWWAAVATDAPILTDDSMTYTFVFTV